MENEEFEHANGKPVEDVVTGFKGLVTCRAAYYLNPNRRYEVTTSHNGNPECAVVSEWFDECRLVAYSPEQKED